LEAQVGADRWTDLDRGISRAAAAAGGVVDLRPYAGERLDAADHARLGRMRKLEQLVRIPMMPPVYSEIMPPVIPI
jgi:hypothetical protein